MQKENKLFSTANLVKMGVLSALAFILMRVLEIPLPIFPTFLKIDFGDVPAVVATLVVHPFAGVIVVLIKNVLALMNSSSGGIGEIVNVIVGITYILPIAFFVRKNGALKSVVLGSMVGIVLMVGAGMITNGLITMPLYGEAACIGAGAAINPAIVDKMTFLLYVIAPFNLLKGIVVGSVSIILVKVIEPLFKYLRGHQTA